MLGGKKLEKWVIIGVSGGAAAGLLIVSILCILLCKRRRRKNHSHSSTHLIRDYHFETHYVDPQLCSADYKTHIFSYAELNDATDGFSPSQELGDGGFGTVYKGDDPEEVKARLKYWAETVACTIKLCN